MLYENSNIISFINHFMNEQVIHWFEITLIRCMKYEWDIQSNMGYEFSKAHWWGLRELEWQLRRSSKSTRIHMVPCVKSIQTVFSTCVNYVNGLHQGYCRRGNLSSMNITERAFVQTNSIMWKFTFMSSVLDIVRLNFLTLSRSR